MDSVVLFLTIVAGVAIGEYLAQFMLYKTDHLWTDDEQEDNGNG